MEKLLADELINDLKLIGSMYGEFQFTAEAIVAIDAWHMAGGPVRPDHPKLVNYLTRRTQHVLKLCMVAAVSTHGKFLITLDDFHTALAWLLEVETLMPDIFKSMAVGGDAKAIEDAYHYAYQVYVKELKPVSEARMIEFLQNRVAAHSVERVLTVMVKSKLLEKRIEGFIPRARKSS